MLELGHESLAVVAGFRISGVGGSKTSVQLRAKVCGFPSRPPKFLGPARRHGKPADEPFAEFSRTPAGVLSLHVQHIVFYLKGKLIRVAIRTSASIGEPLNAAFLVAIENLVAGLARDPKLPTKFRHRLAG